MPNVQFNMFTHTNKNIVEVATQNITSMAEHPSHHALECTFITRIKQDKIHVKLFYCTACVTCRCPLLEQQAYMGNTTNTQSKCVRANKGIKFQEALYVAD